MPDFYLDPDPQTGISDLIHKRDSSPVRLPCPPPQPTLNPNPQMREEIMTAKKIEEELKGIPYPRIRQMRLLEYSRVDFLR